MPVSTTHSNAEERPAGRSTFSTLAAIRRWFRTHAIFGRWAAFFGALTDPTVTIEVSHSRSGEPKAEQQNLSVISANLWHDWPRYRDLPDRLESLAQLVEEQGAQVVLLQEALRTPSLSASEWLADRLQMTHGYVRANGAEKAIGFEEGPAILTNLHVRKHRALKLGTVGDPWVRRMALGAQLELECCSIWVVSTHLSFLRSQNRRQVEHLHRWVNQLAGEGSAVIGGDFNSVETSPGIQFAQKYWRDTYREVNPDSSGHTHLLRSPWGHTLRSQRLDYLFLKAGQHAWRVVAADHLPSEGMPHSDHKAVLARLHPPQAKEPLCSPN